MSWFSFAHLDRTRSRLPPSGCLPERSEPFPPFRGSLFPGSLVCLGMKSDWMLSLSQLYHGCLHGLYRHLFGSLPGLCGAPSFEGWDGPMPRPQHTPKHFRFQGVYEKILAASKHWKGHIGFLNFTFACSFTKISYQIPAESSSLLSSSA